jgi:hypothetical protein
MVEDLLRISDVFIYCCGGVKMCVLELLPVMDPLSNPLVTD